MRDSSAKYALLELDHHISPILYKMFEALHASERAVKNSKRPLHDRWLDELNKFAHFDKKTIREQSDNVLKTLKRMCEGFDLEECLKRYLANTLCVVCCFAFRDCVGRISLHRDEVREFINMLLCAVSKELIESHLFGDASKLGYIQKKETRKFVFRESMEAALLEFLVVFRDRHKDQLKACAMMDDSCGPRAPAAPHYTPHAYAPPGPRAFEPMASPVASPKHLAGAFDDDGPGGDDDDEHSDEDDGGPGDLLSKLRARIEAAKKGGPAPGAAMMPGERAPAQVDDEGDPEEDEPEPPRGLRFSTKNEVQPFHRKASSLDATERVSAPMKAFDGEVEDDDDTGSVSSYQNLEDDEQEEDDSGCSKLKKKLDRLKSILKK